MGKTFGQIIRGWFVPQGGGEPEQLRLALEIESPRASQLLRRRPLPATGWISFGTRAKEAPLTTAMVFVRSQLGLTISYDISFFGSDAARYRLRGDTQIGLFVWPEFVSPMDAQVFRDGLLNGMARLTFRRFELQRSLLNMLVPDVLKP